MQTAPKHTALIIGATSSLAQALARELAGRGYALILAGRDEDELNLLATDISARYPVAANVVLFDFLSPDFSAHALIASAGSFTHAIIVAGDMADGNSQSNDTITRTANLNYVLPAHIANEAAQHLLAQSSGTIVIISSVAGDRGRQSNYAYGSAKAALSAFASGLRNYCFPRGVHVMTVKPGFIDTPMTWGMQSPLIASREFVAGAFVKAMEAKKDVVYVPFFWRYIMLIIMHVPEKIFKKLKL